MKRLPEDFQAERSLLATLCGPGMEGKAATVLAGLEACHFIAPQHRDLFLALRELVYAGEEVNALTLRGELEAAGKLGSVGGFTGLTEILASEEVGRPEALAKIILDRWRRRRWIALGSKLEGAAADLSQDEAELQSVVTQEVLAIQAGNTAKRKSTLAILDRLEALEAFNKTHHRGFTHLIHLGVPEFDEVLERGPGQIILVAARPKVGKTALMVHGFAETISRGQKALFISLELDEDELSARIAARLTSTAYSELRRGEYGRGAIRSAQDQSEALARGSYVCAPSGTSWSVLEAEIRTAVLREGITSVWLDYFTLIGKPQGSKGQTDASLWGQLSTQIRGLAQSLGITVVLASQLNRSNTEYDEPGPSDLRETGQLEQDAHAILMLWLAKDPSADYPLAKIAVNRAGKTLKKTRMACDFTTNTWAVDHRETNPSSWFQSAACDRGAIS